MGTGLQDPALALAAPLQVLELTPVKLVHGGPVAVVVDPILEGRHAERVVEDGRRHRVHREDDALLGEACAHRVHGPEARNQPVDPAELGVALRDPGVARVAGAFGRRRGRVALPGERRPAPRVLGQDVVQDRGARAGESDDDERAADLDRGDLGMPLAVGNQLEAVADDADQCLPRDRAAEEGELRFFFEGGQQQAQRLEEGAVAEIVGAPGLADGLFDE